MNVLLLSTVMVAMNLAASAQKMNDYAHEPSSTKDVEAKNAGKETAWDYVEDVPGLPRILVIGDSISRGCTMPLRHELKGKVNVHRAPSNM